MMPRVPHSESLNAIVSSVSARARVVAAHKTLTTKTA
jgi:hypothetical protein